MPEIQIAEQVSSDNVASEIAAMLSSREAGRPVSTVQRSGTESFNTTTGDLVTVAHAGGPIPDSGRDLIGQHNQDLARYDALRAQIDEIEGYDAAGQPQFKRTPAERASLTARAASMAQSLEYQAAHYRELLAQREATKARAAQDAAEAEARFAFTQGDKQRSAALDAAILAEHARLAASAILSARRGK